MNWPVYDEYKDAEAPWLGEVPRHWLVDRMKWSVESSQNGIWGSEPDGGSDDIRCVRVADFDRQAFSIHDRDVTYRKVSESERIGRLLRRGDLILEKSGGGEKNPVGFVVLYDRDEAAVTSNFVARVTLRAGMEPRFWTYLHHWLYSSRLTQPSIKQTSGIQNLDQQSYFDERVCFPPSHEQVQIANFLDRETAKIDGLIAKQEQLIATLREDRAATITQAVTKGLDPNVEMKDDEPDFPAVPAHWQVQPIKRTGRLITGGTPATTDEGNYVPSGDGLPWFRPEDLDTTGLPSSASRFISESGQAAVPLVQAPSVHVVSIGATLGKIGYVDVDSSSNQQITAVVGASCPRYTYFALVASYERIWASSMGNTLPIISAGRLGTVRIPVPPTDEQASIAEYLDDRCTGIDALVDKSNEVIATLREYRSALITDAVTGKIDVRGVA